MSSGETQDPGFDALFGLEPEQGESWLELARAALGPAPPLGRLGPYELLEELGRGGQGTVYRARQPLTERMVALKCLPARAFEAESSRERFRREGAALARLAHPGIVAIHGAELIDGHAVLVMEWVDGQAIDLWARARPPREIAEVCAAVCDALAHAHRRGVLHRDLKPTNILVDGSGRPRVLDFGLARLMEGQADGQVEVSLTAAFLGTPSFAPAEQIEGRWADVDTRSDVYSLGAVMHLLLGGRPAFGSDTGLPELFDRIRAGLPERPTPVRERAGRELDWIVRTALALEPQRRYQSVDALGDDLRRWLRGEAVSAHPPSGTYRLRKAWGRHRSAFLAGGLLTAALLAFTVSVTVLALRLQRQGERMEATLERERAASRAQSAAATFLGNLLGGTGNLGRVGPDAALEPLLDQGVADLDHGRLRGQPAVEAEMRMQLGRAYRGLGRFEAGERQHRLAVELALAADGETSLLASRALDYLMRTLELCGELAEAESCGRRSVQIAEALLGPDSIEAVGVRNDLASVLDEQGRYAESEALYRLGLEAAQRSPGLEGARSGMHRSVGLELIEQGRFEEAEYHTRQALALASSNDADSERFARTQRNLARILAATGRGEEAVTLLRDCLRLWIGIYGEEHPLVAVEQARLAELLSVRGSHAESGELYALALATLETSVGANHPWTIRVQRSAGQALLSAQDLPAALQHLRAAHAGALLAPAGCELLVAQTALALADGLRSQGDVASARDVLVTARARELEFPPLTTAVRDEWLERLDAALREHD